jgi:hypothetical protein
MARYIRPGFVLARLANPIVIGLGLSPTLTIAGRRTGVERTIPFGGPFVHGGVRYLVSGRGLTDWARNLRAARRGRMRLDGKEVAFRTVEVDGPERESVLAAYRAKFGGAVRRYFEQLPDAADHPVFRVEVV